MSSTNATHPQLSTIFNKDEARVDWHDETLWWIRQKRDKAAWTIPEWEQLRDTASAIKNNVLSNLHNYLLEFEEKAIANGMIIHWAADAKEHNEIVHAILQKNNVNQIVKSKSMLTEECGLNEYLAQHNFDVIDTDLGERIVQLAGEHPSHIVLPCIHWKKEEIGELFHQHLNTPKGNADPQFLTNAARIHLREKFLTRRIAITGVNFAVAETGEFVVCTNEGNADMGAHLADVHIACMGIEKIIPQRKHLGIFLVDNRRTLQLGREDFRSSLKCIRCAACFNTCPVYRRSGGHSYHTAIAGPIGAILAPNLNMKKYADLPFASTLCGSCSNVCPVKIDIHNQLYKWRQVITEEGFSPKIKTVAMKMMAATLSKSKVFNIAGKAGRWVMKYFPFFVNNKFNPWYTQRDLPAPPKQSFTEWYKKNRK